MEVIFYFIIKFCLVGSHRSRIINRVNIALKLLHCSLLALNFLLLFLVLWRSHYLFLIKLVILYSWFFERKFARQDVHNNLFFVLSPTEVYFFHFLFVMLHPPIPVFEQRSDHDRIVALAYKIFVDHVWRRQNLII